MSSSSPLSPFSLIQCSHSWSFLLFIFTLSCSLILFQDCSFNKLQSDTALKVAFQGNMRVQGSSGRCNRWYFKFNGNECSGPMTIEAVSYNYWPSGNPNLYYHRSFKGGTVRTFHRARLEWNCGSGGVPVAIPWVMLTLDGDQCPG